MAAVVWEDTDMPMPGNTELRERFNIGGVILVSDLTGAFGHAISVSLSHEGIRHWAGSWSAVGVARPFVRHGRREVEVEVGFCVRCRRPMDDHAIMGHPEPLCPVPARS